MIRRALAAVSLLIGVALVGASVGQLAAADPTSGVVPVGAVSATSAPPGEAAPATVVDGVGTVASPPLGVGLPTLGVDAPVVPVDATPAGALAVPDDPAVLGWWRAGAAPGADRGSVVVDGHVDTREAGPGALFRLADLRPGEPVEVRTAAGPVRYAVAAVRRYPKADLPAEVFDRTGPPRLVLISCGGAFDPVRRSYADNVVVYAVPVPTAAVSGSAGPGTR